ncbi:MAG: 50S ribosomal protein L4 [Candidatus Paceibacterota bacterium]
MNAKIYSYEGKEVGDIALPANVFGVEWNADLVHEVVIGMQANARTSSAHTKDRSEVRGGGKKPWKQKGTGRARHGSSRSPIWAGGGVAHGPRNDKDYSVKINKKVRAKALAVVISKKTTDGELILVDSLSLSEPKTAQGKEIIKALAKATGFASLATKRKNAAVVILPKRDEVAEKSFRNFGNVEVMQAKDVNPVDLLTYKYVVMVEPASTVETLSKRVLGTAVVTKK